MEAKYGALNDLTKNDYPGDTKRNQGRPRMARRQGRHRGRLRSAHTTDDITGQD